MKLELKKSLERTWHIVITAYYIVFCYYLVETNQNRKLPR